MPGAKAVRSRRSTTHSRASIRARSSVGSTVTGFRQVDWLRAAAVDRPHLGVLGGVGVQSGQEVVDIFLLSLRQRGLDPDLLANRGRGAAGRRYRAEAAEPMGRHQCGISGSSRASRCTRWSAPGSPDMAVRRLVRLSGRPAPRRRPASPQLRPAVRSREPSRSATSLCPAHAPTSRIARCRTSGGSSRCQGG